MPKNKKSKSAIWRSSTANFPKSWTASSTSLPPKSNNSKQRPKSSRKLPRTCIKRIICFRTKHPWVRVMLNALLRVIRAKVSRLLNWLVWQTCLGKRTTNSGKTWPERLNRWKNNTKRRCSSRNRKPRRVLLWCSRALLSRAKKWKSLATSSNCNQRQWSNNKKRSTRRKRWFRSMKASWRRREDTVNIFLTTWAWLSKRGSNWARSASTRRRKSNNSIACTSNWQQTKQISTEPRRLLRTSFRTSERNMRSYRSSTKLLLSSSSSKSKSTSLSESISRRFCPWLAPRMALRNCRILPILLRCLVNENRLKPTWISQWSSLRDKQGSLKIRSLRAATSRKQLKVGERLQLHRRSNAFECQNIKKYMS